MSLRITDCMSAGGTALSTAWRQDATSLADGLLRPPRTFGIKLSQLAPDSPISPGGALAPAGAASPDGVAGAVAGSVAGRADGVSTAGALMGSVNMTVLLQQRCETRNRELGPTSAGPDGSLHAP